MKIINSQQNMPGNTATTGDKLCNYAEGLGFGDLHIRVNPELGLTAIVAVHSTKRGPAIGGCRFLEYPCVEAAIEAIVDEVGARAGQ